MQIEMNMALALITLPVGLLILIKSADLLVDGAVALAERFGVSPLVIGLTIVAMGTSAPEVAASITAAIAGRGNAAIGNVYGSNIANLALVGGVIALIRPVVVSRSVIKRDIPAMLIVALLLWPFLQNLHLTRIESAVLLALFLVLLSLTIFYGLKQAKAGKPIPEELREVVEVPQKLPRSLPASVIFVIVGLAGLAFGAKLTVDAAVYIGERLGLSDAVIGLTIIAVGTSLPELMTCVVAAIKKQDDISIGNLVGSNIFNTLLVIGTAGIFRPIDLNARLIGPDYWIMIATSALFLIFLLPKARLSRIAGAILAGGYFIYLGYLLIFTRSQ